MECTKPRVLIKIIYFCQSWPRENLQQYQQTALFFRPLLYLTLHPSHPLSISLSIRVTACIKHGEKKSITWTGIDISSIIVSFWRLTSLLYILGLSSGAESHTYHEGREWRPDLHLFQGFIPMGAWSCDWILLLLLCIKVHSGRTWSTNLKRCQPRC